MICYFFYLTSSDFFDSISSLHFSTSYSRGITYSTQDTTTMASELPKTMKAAVLTGVGKPLEIQDIPLPEMGAGEILIKVHACGVCHSDSSKQDFLHSRHTDNRRHMLTSSPDVAAGDFGPPAISILGHEFIGTVVAVPSTEKKWAVGDRVGGPWHGGHDGTCRSCSRGQFQMCDNKTVNGVFRNGGYGEYATLRTESAVRIPKEMDPAETAPLLCAGVTVFNGIRKMGIIGGETVAIQGLGGLGEFRKAAECLRGMAD